MPIKMKYASKDEIPEAFRELFTEKEGAFVLTGVEGLPDPAEATRLRGALDKERNDHKATKSRLSAFADKSEEELTEILGKLDRFDELEAAAKDKLPEEKISELADKRVQAKLAPVQRELDKAKKDLADITSERDNLAGEKRTRTIHDSVREAATKAKLRPEAVDDALMYAERVFEITEDGKVVAKDGVGVMPGIDATAWFTDLKEKRPHWWPTSTGGGAGGGGGGGGGGNNPWSKDHWNLTEQGKLYKENPERAKQLAQMAGHNL